MYEIKIKIKKRMQIDEKDCGKKYSTLLNTEQQNFALGIFYLERCDWSRITQLLQSHR